MSPERRFRPRARSTNLRDSKLIVVATEGATERSYFKTLISPEYYQRTRVHLEILEPKDPTKSAPEHVVGELDDFKKEFKLEKGDELWMLIDYDRWGDAKIAQISTLAFQKGYFLAVSRPCFELWILLHLNDLNSYSDDEKRELLENVKDGKRTTVDQEILKCLGSYNKTNPHCERFVQNVEVAIARAAVLSPVSIEGRWPDGLGTDVYRLAHTIINSR